MGSQGVWCTCGLGIENPNKFAGEQMPGTQAYVVRGREVGYWWTVECADVRTAEQWKWVAVRKASLIRGVKLGRFSNQASTALRIWSCRVAGGYVQ